MELGHDMANTEDSSFARTVIDGKFATADEVATCREQVKKMRRSGTHANLAQVLVERGFLTDSQCRRLSEDSHSDSMYKPAQQIPGYQILGKIGQGAMATVFKAKQLSLDRIVAIKVLPKRMSENAEFVNRFYKEGRAAAKLNHVNIVQAIDVGEAGGYHYFVMEYIDGKTVWDDLREKGIYPEKEAIETLIQTTRALEHSHERGLIHRDIKPKNIMITKTGVVKLADMGLARETSDVEAAMAEAGRAYGTPYYISPEQIRGEVSIDFRADIYSLGATFYHMVTGRVPFEGSTPSEVMHKHLKEPMIPPDHLNQSLTAGIGEAIEVMMAKDREDRYPSTKDLLLDLAAMQRGEPPLIARRKYDHDTLQGLASGGMTLPRSSTKAEKKVNPWWIVLALSFLLLLAVLVILAQFLGR